MLCSYQTGPSNLLFPAVHSIINKIGKCFIQKYYSCNTITGYLVNRSFILIDSVTGIFPERENMVLSEYQCELFDRVNYYFTTSECERVYLPPLRGKVLSNCKNIIDNMNDALKRFSTSALSELCNLCYCAARVVIEEGGVSVPSSSPQKTPPPWEVRLLSRLRRCKQDLSHLHELCNGKLLSQHKVYGLTSRYNLNVRSAEEACEEVNQTVKALSLRLKRYRHNRSCRQQNCMFSSNQHKFYQQIGNQPVSLAPPPFEETLKFWKNLWITPRSFNKNASWKEIVNRDYSPMAFSKLEREDFIRALKRIPNWKSPGLDFIYGYWLKKFHSLHGMFLYHFNELLSGSSPLDPSLVAGRTVLIVKNPSKGNVPTNYRPITCLSTVWKFLSSILRFVLHRHLSEVGAIPFQQKGCMIKSKGSKDHLIIDKFVTEDARKRHRNLFMAWLDVKKEPMIQFPMTGYCIV